MYIISKRNKLEEYNTFLTSQNKPIVTSIAYNSITQEYCLLLQDLSDLSSTSIFSGDTVIHDIITWWWKQDTPYKLIIDSIEALKHIVEQDYIGQVLNQLLPDFKEQIEVNQLSEVYLNSLVPYSGIDVKVLLTEYPLIFVQLLNNPKYNNNL